MNFNSLQYLIFLPIVLLLYWIIPARFRYILLLIASYYFYMSWNVLLVFPIILTTIISFIFAFLIEKSEKKKTKKLFLILTLIICLGTLFFFKYFNFLVESVCAFLSLFTLKITTPVFDILLPVGISFYTFQTLSYVIDVYRDDIKAERNFLYYALYVVYFPQLVAGPIERPENLIPQLKEEHKFSLDGFIQGIFILALGFFRKCVVADFCGIYVNNVFSSLENASSMSVFIAGFLFCFQMYCDFAGYSEIALGTAMMMGINLSVNFNRPYLAKNYSEFFRRWHISLSSWFRDYLYIPLGGSRKGLFRKILNTFIVFGLCGLWHGADWSYLLWGLYAAFFISLESLLRKPVNNFIKKYNINIDNIFVDGIRIALMMIIYIPASLIFRGGKLSISILALERLFDFKSNALGLFTALNIDYNGVIYLALALITMCLIYYFIENVKKGEILNPNEKIRRFVILDLLIITIALSWLALIASQDSSAFSYFQF